jgi:hypothetical protein
VGGWYDEKQTRPATLQLDGFVYEAIDADDVTVGDRLDWLRRYQGRYQGGSLPQPYEQGPDRLRRRPGLRNNGTAISWRHRSRYAAS